MSLASTSGLLSIFQPSERHAYSSSLYDRLEKLATVDSDDWILLDATDDEEALTDAEALLIVREWLDLDQSTTQGPRFQEALAIVLTNDLHTRQLTSFRTSLIHLSCQQTIWPQIHAIEPQYLDERVLENIEETLQSTCHLLVAPLDSWLKRPTAGLCHADLQTRLGRRNLQQAVSDWREILLIEWATLPSPLTGARVTPYILTLLTSLTSSTSPWQLPSRSARLLQSLCDLGLSDLLQQALAYATFGVINTQVHSHHLKVDWVGKQSVITKLEQWVKTRLEPAVRACQHAIGCMPRTGESFASDQRLWSEMALDTLGHNRALHLLRHIQMWDRSIGAILDLREFIRTPEAKRLIVSALHQQMHRDLLHAGAQTSELLTIYINIIKAFKVLDGRNVLLAKVAEPLRAFLAAREDTVQVIAASFLADESDATSLSEDICLQLVKEVSLSAEADEPKDHKALDWDDMEWMPDPLDAGPDFERSRRDDIISYMLRLSDPERFYDKVRRLLCNRLLRSDSADTDKETCLVELLKARRELDKDKLTECEVMLRDMRDSKRLLKTIQKQTLPPPSAREIHAAIGDGIEFAELLNKFKDRLSPKSEESAIRAFCDMANKIGIRDNTTKMITRRPDVQISSDAHDQPDFSAKILSSVFWPTLRDANFSIPEPAAVLQAQYESHFVRFKDMRKLQWLSAQGRASVVLHLEDRHLTFESIPAWQASVIYAFQSASPSAAEPDSTSDLVTKTKAELADALDMDDVLLQNALDFWVSARVLRELEPDTFCVLETLDAVLDDQPAPSAQVPKQADLGAAKSQSALLDENRILYETFIVNMLTNGGAMDVDRMAMMLGMVVPGGFEFGGEGVKVLCSGLAGQGRLVQDGETFKVKK